MMSSNINTFQNRYDKHDMSSERSPDWKNPSVALEVSAEPLR